MVHIWVSISLSITRVLNLENSSQLVYIGSVKLLKLGKNCPFSEDVDSFLKNIMDHMCINESFLIVGRSQTNNLDVQNTHSFQVHMGCSLG